MATLFPKPWLEVRRHLGLAYVGSPHPVCTGANEPPANPNDLTAIPAGPTTSEQEGSRGHKRKQTLLSLLDALAELSKDEELEGLGAFQAASNLSHWIVPVRQG